MGVQGRFRSTQNRELYFDFHFFDPKLFLDVLKNPDILDDAALDKVALFCKVEKNIV